MDQEQQRDLSEERFNEMTMFDESELEDEYVSRCPACDEPIDYCQGHGEIGDPIGFLILKQHDEGDHGACHDDAECRQVTE